MTSIFKSFLMVFLLGTLSLHAGSVEKGQKVYQQKLKKACGQSGGKFAALKTQDEWTELKEDEKLTEFLLEQCPRAKSFLKSDFFQKKKKKHLFNFLYEFGSDSGNIPAC